MVNDPTKHEFSFEVKKYIVDATRNPPGWSIPSKNSMTTIGLLAAESNSNAVLYFYWPNEVIAKQGPPVDHDGTLTLHLHYPMSAFAARIALLQGPSKLIAYYSTVTGNVLTGIKQTKHIDR